MPQTTVGLPTKVKASDPIEFLQLSKFVNAFLDLNLEENKGGIRNQLLCEHLLGFIQKNGINAIEKWPRFKPEYLEELILNCQEKGIDLFQTPRDFSQPSFEKIKEKETSILIHQQKQKTPTMKEKSLADKRREYANNVLLEISRTFNGTIKN